MKSVERIVAFDPTFIPKSGKQTYGLDYFWNGCHSRAEKGLEISSVAIVDIQQKYRIYPLGNSDRSFSR